MCRLTETRALSAQGEKRALVGNLTMPARAKASKPAVRQVTIARLGRAVTAGLRRQLPTTIRAVTILADGDTAGDQAARAAATRWTREGRTVRIARPPTGLDFNDVLLGYDVVNSKEEA